MYRVKFSTNTSCLTRNWNTHGTNLTCLHLLKLRLNENFDVDFLLGVTRSHYLPVIFVMGHQDSWIFARSMVL